jgi:formate hydrogenlyase subunit 4
MHPVVTGVLSLFLFIGLAPLAEGLLRKFKARIHSRQGPPLTQPYLDIAKLLAKEDLSPTGNWVWRIAPAFALGSTMVLALMTPIGRAPALNPAGDMVVFVYFAALAAVAIILGAFASGNPYSSVGGSREMMMLLSVEPVMVISLFVAAFKARTMTFSGVMDYHHYSISMALAGITFLLALQAQIGKLPFDIAEAEQEIMEGPFIERSGPGLALFKWTLHARLLIFSALLVSVFVPWPHLANPGLALLATLVKMAVLLLLIGLVDVVNPRLRIDQSMHAYSRVIIWGALVALLFAVVGA